MRRLLILLAVPLAFGALPAAAQQQNQYAQNTVAPAEQSGSNTSANQPRADDPNRRICVNAQLSGSHVTRRICRTAREWEAQGGFDND